MENSLVPASVVLAEIGLCQVCDNGPGDDDNDDDDDSDVTIRETGIWNVLAFARQEKSNEKWLVVALWEM